MPIIPANWDDYDSDLTSLASEDETDEEIPPLPETTPAPPQPKIITRPSTKEATAKSQKKARTNPHLAPPRICQYSAYQLHKMLHEGQINLDPEYQRDVVWNAAKQTALIDSLIHNYYIPPIIFSVTYRSGNIPGKIVCIDGKQRLTSIKRFMDGEIPHKDTFSGRKSYFVNGPAQRRKLLTKPELQEFENQQIACVEYLNLTDEDEREIFQRVQMGVALTPAERMNAINAPYATLARELQARRQLFDSQLKFQDTQKREYLAILQIIVMITTDSSKILEPKNQKVETFLAKKDPVTTTARNAITIAINIFCLLIEDPVLGRPFCHSKHKLVPIEYVMAVYLIHLHRSKLSLTQLSDAVHHMREHLRLNFKEPQFGTAFKSLLTYVTKGVLKLALKSDRRGDRPAEPSSVAAKLDAMIASRSNERVAPSRPSSKRKRLEGKDDDNNLGDDSEDDRPLVQRRVGPGRPRRVMTTSDDEAIIKPAPTPKIKTPTSKASAMKVVSINAAASSSGAITTVKRGTYANKKTGVTNSRTSNAIPTKVAPQTAKPTVKPSASSRINKLTGSAAPSPTSPIPRLASQIKMLPTPPTVSSDASTSNIRSSQTVPSSSSSTSSHFAPSIRGQPLARLDLPGQCVKSEPKNTLSLPHSMSSTNGAPTSISPSDRLAPIRAAKQRLASLTIQRPNTPTTNMTSALAYGSRHPQHMQPTPPLAAPSGNIDPNDRLKMDCDNLLQDLPSISRPRSARATAGQQASLSKPLSEAPRIDHTVNLQPGSSSSVPLIVDVDMDSGRNTTYTPITPLISPESRTIACSTVNGHGPVGQPQQQCFNTPARNQPMTASPTEIFSRESRLNAGSRSIHDGQDDREPRNRSSSRYCDTAL